MWECSNCHRPIADCQQGILTADDDLTGWRVVHHISCDPNTGPWHELALFVGRRGHKNFNAMLREGAFDGLTPIQVEALRAAVVRENYDESRVQRIQFRKWLFKQLDRDDPIGDLANDIKRDSLQQLPNPSLNELYHHLRVQGASHIVLAVLVEAYREWQSYGNTYRQTGSRKAKPARQVLPPKPVQQRDGWLALRFRIFKRDGYRCQICGRTAKDDGVKLEVDHKMPRSKGGSDDPANLWCLCFDCNRGKRDHLL